MYQIGREVNSLRWWITSLSYRNAYSSKTLHRTCYLKVALDLVRGWDHPEPLVLIVDRVVHRALKDNLAAHGKPEAQFLGRVRPWSQRFSPDLVNMLVHRAFFLCQEGYRILVSRLMVRRPHVPRAPTTVLISWATRDNIRQGGDFHRSFFGDLAVQLGTLGCRVAVSPFILRNLSYYESLRLLKNSSLPLMLHHRHLGLADLVRTSLASCAQAPLPRTLPPFEGMSIKGLLAEDIRTHWVGNGSPVALLIAATVRSWARVGASIERIIYIYENQPWERALCWEAERALPRTELVGYQPTPVPKLLLNFYLAPGEKEVAPLPRRLVTVGAQVARLLSADGYDPGCIRVGGALQVQNLRLLKSRAGTVNDGGAAPTVLVAATGGREDTAELVAMAAGLFDGDEGVRVVMKCHPSMPFYKVSGLTATRLPGHVRLSEEPVTELMLKSSVMVYSGSTVCIQALALGLPVVHLRTQFDFSLDPLETVPDLRLEATGLEELRQKVRWLLENREEYIARHKDAWNRVVEDMYGPVTEETFLAFLGTSAHGQPTSQAV